MNIDVGIQCGVNKKEHSKHLFVVRLPVENMNIARNEFLLQLHERKIGASIHYRPLHSMPLYREYSKKPLLNTEMLYKEILTLPIGASVTMEDAKYVIDHFTDLLKKGIKSGKV